MTNKKPIPQCVKCTVRRCKTRDANAKVPKFCPTDNYPKLIKESIKRHKLPENKRINEAWVKMVNKLIVNAPGRDAWSWTRVDEIMEFARIRKWKKIGIATCSALMWESKFLSDLLEQNGFEVISICCLCGQVEPSEVDLKSNVFCNPILQALIMNENKTDLNIIVGLCLGHDILFQKNAEAETTTLIVKDRALGHNPIMALYLSQGFYKKRFDK